MRAIGVCICIFAILFLATLVLFKLGCLNWWTWIAFILLLDTVEEKIKEEEGKKKEEDKK